MKRAREISAFVPGGTMKVPKLEDGYGAAGQFPEPALCPGCGASYRDGRWSWRKAPASATRHNCPACQRIHDEFPAGYVTLRGDFPPEHREAIVTVVRERERLALAEHPLQRIMAIENVAEGIRVTTTDTPIAREIARAIQDRFKGEVRLRYFKEEHLLRAVWSR